MLTNVFTKNHFSDGFYKKFIQLISEQDVYNRSFLAYASVDMISSFEQKMSVPEITEVLRMRNIALSANKRTELANELNKVTGYGGMIHDYKNYLYSQNLNLKNMKKS